MNKIERKKNRKIKSKNKRRNEKIKMKCMYRHTHTHIVHTEMPHRRNEEKLCAQCTLVELNNLTIVLDLLSMFELRCLLSFVTFFLLLLIFRIEFFFFCQMIP